MSEHSVKQSTAQSARERKELKGFLSRDLFVLSRVRCHWMNGGGCPLTFAFLAAFAVDSFDGFTEL